MTPTREAGFTLLELLIVLAIMGVVIGVVVTRGPIRSQALQTRAAAGALAQTFRGARAQAIARSQTVTVAINPARRSFAADQGPIRVLNAAVALEPGTVRGPNNTGLVRFSPDGSASGGGVILGDGKRRTQIDVEWLTGRVRISNAP